MIVITMRQWRYFRKLFKFLKISILTIKCMNDYYTISIYLTTNLINYYWWNLIFFEEIFYINIFTIKMKKNYHKIILKYCTSIQLINFILAKSWIFIHSFDETIFGLRIYLNRCYFFLIINLIFRNKLMKIHFLRT